MKRKLDEGQWTSSEKKLPKLLEFNLLVVPKEVFEFGIIPFCNFLEVLKLLNVSRATREIITEFTKYISVNVSIWQFKSENLLSILVKLTNLKKLEIVFKEILNSTKVYNFSILKGKFKYLENLSIKSSRKYGIFEGGRHLRPNMEENLLKIKNLDEIICSFEQIKDLRIESISSRFDDISKLKLKSLSLVNCKNKSKNLNDFFDSKLIWNKDLNNLQMNQILFPVEKNKLTCSFSLLKHFPKLQHLDLGGNFINQQTFDSISTIISLISLKINVLSVNIDNLNNLKNLKEFKLLGRFQTIQGVSMDNLESLECETVPNSNMLNFLNLKHFKQLPNMAIQNIDATKYLSFSQLESIELNTTHSNINSLSALKNLKSFKYKDPFFQMRQNIKSPIELPQIEIFHFHQQDLKPPIMSGENVKELVLSQFHGNFPFEKFQNTEVLEICYILSHRITNMKDVLTLGRLKRFTLKGGKYDISPKFEETMEYVKKLLDQQGVEVIHIIV
jgi:hypothetical protein